MINSKAKGTRAGCVPRKASGQYALQVYDERPDLTVPEIVTIVQERHPEYTVQALRMLLHRHGISLLDRVYTGGKKYEGKPKADVVVKEEPKPEHIPIQSYHGRSRYLPAYYEL